MQSIVYFYFTFYWKFCRSSQRSCWDRFKDESTLIFTKTSQAFSVLLPPSIIFRFWYLTCLDRSINQYKILVFTCGKFLLKNRNFITLLSVLQHKSASNSLLIFAGSRQAKGTCCPNFKHNTPSSTSFPSGNSFSSSSFI
jgi:hypothetical protein